MISFEEKTIIDLSDIKLNINYQKILDELNINKKQFNICKKNDKFFKYFSQENKIKLNLYINKYCELNNHKEEYDILFLDIKFYFEKGNIFYKLLNDEITTDDFITELESVILKKIKRKYLYLKKKFISKNVNLDLFQKNPSLIYILTIDYLLNLINNCNYNGSLDKFDKEVKLIINKLGLYSALVYNTNSSSSFYYKYNKFKSYITENFFSDRDLNNIFLNEKYITIFISQKDYILTNAYNEFYTPYIMFGLKFNLFTKQDLLMINLGEVCERLIYHTNLSNKTIKKLFIDTKINNFVEEQINEKNKKNNTLQILIRFLLKVDDIDGSDKSITYLISELISISKEIINTEKKILFYSYHNLSDEEKEYYFNNIITILKKYSNILSELLEVNESEFIEKIGKIEYE